jgi:degradative hydroxymethylglutaryl-CoA reductase
MTSALPGFFKLSPTARIASLAANFHLTDDDIAVLTSPDAGLDSSVCQTMIENFVGRHITPIGIATNFVIDGREVVIPMATEEPSVIAGASLAAKLCRVTGGFVTSAGPNICSGQVAFICPENCSVYLEKICSLTKQILKIANDSIPSMSERRGGGVVRAEGREVLTASGAMIVVDLDVHVCDSMGANTVIRVCERVKEYLSEELCLIPLLGVVTNLSESRLVFARGRWKLSDLGGVEIGERIKMAADLGRADAKRGATHRKGIMNGVSAIALVTGNDTRAIEAAVHSYAGLAGSNPALTEYRIEKEDEEEGEEEGEESGYLIGEILLPIPVGVVGGSMNRDKTVKVMRKLMGVENADALAQMMAAVGLAQNLAALKALVTEGIGAGHMRLHSRNIASEAGAKGEEITKLAEHLIHSGMITVSAGKSFLENMRCELH